MKITKTQIDYLRNRLDEIKDEKIRALSKKTKVEVTSFDVYEALKSGEIKLKAKKDIYSRTWTAGSYYNPDLEDFFDLSKYKEKFKDNGDIVDAYRDRLNKKMTEIMDKVVLSDLLIEEAVAEFKKM